MIPKPSSFRRISARVQARGTRPSMLLTTPGPLYAVREASSTACAANMAAPVASSQRRSDAATTAAVPSSPCQSRQRTHTKAALYSVQPSACARRVPEWCG